MTFKPTAESLNKLHQITSQMRERSFHDHYHILYDIRNSIKKHEVNYLEIGAYAGGSASLMISHPKKTNVFTIDLGQPIPKEVVIFNLEKFKAGANEFKYFEGNSQDPRIVKQVKLFVPKVDILFIDGDHSEQGVLADFHNYKDLVVPGGYIVFDDYMDWENSPDIKTAIDELDFTGYKVIGSIKYPELSQSNVSLASSNEFIIQKLGGTNPEPPKTIPTLKDAQIKQMPTLSTDIAIRKNTTEHTICEVSPDTLLKENLGFPLFVLESKLNNILQKPPSDETQKKITQLNRSIQMLKTPFL